MKRSTSDALLDGLNALAVALTVAMVGCFVVASVHACGRGGAAPCVPQPALSNTGPGGSGPLCAVRR